MYMHVHYIVYKEHTSCEMQCIVVAFALHDLKFSKLTSNDNLWSKVL